MKRHELLAALDRIAEMTDEEIAIRALKSIKGDKS